MKPETIDYYKKIIAQQKQFNGTIREFCQSIGISEKTFYGARNEILKQDIQMIPVQVKETGILKETGIRFKINGIPIEIDSSVSDTNLERIIKACACL